MANTAFDAPPPEVVTPDALDSRLGRLEFVNGAPTDDTVEKAIENLVFTHALNVYLNCYGLASLRAIVDGQRTLAEDGTFLLYSELMDSGPLFLTANCDTIYLLTILDLADGPMVLEAPPTALGAIDDLWFHWVIDVGFPGPDRGVGGKYLIVGPGYDGVLPESGYHVAHATTTVVVAFMRFFLDHDDPAPVVAMIKEHANAYRYTPGGYGSSIASILDGRVPLSALVPQDPPPAARFIEASGKAINTLPASDYHFFEQINETVQSQPSGAYDVELAGQIAAIGIVKGQTFEPDARLKRILTEAAAVGNATGRALMFRPHQEWAFYPGSSWQNMLFEGGYMFETPPPEVTPEGLKPYPPTGARTLDARTSFFTAATGVTPGMIMRLRHLGSQYLMSCSDQHMQHFDGARHYRITLPKDIPAERFWSLTLYDNQTRSMLRTPQRFPRAGSQSYPTPEAAADRDGSTVVHIGPTQPEGVERGNWIQTMPDQGWFVALRLYSPLDGFFDKSWRPSEVEAV